MKCPTCPDATLVMAERQGVEIDYCPQCRGVWLDRGELDKILERSTQVEAAPQPAVQREQRPYQSDDRGRRDRHGYDRGHDRGYDKHYDKRKKSWLYDIFD